MKTGSELDGLSTGNSRVADPSFGPVPGTGLAIEGPLDIVASVRSTRPRCFL
jgi:hypothetical protein